MVFHLTQTVFKQSKSKVQKNTKIGRNIKLLKQRRKWQATSIATISKSSFPLLFSFPFLSLHVDAEQSRHSKRGDYLGLQSLIAYQNNLRKK